MGKISFITLDLTWSRIGFSKNLKSVVQTASKFIKSGTHKKVLVIGADKMSSIVDYTCKKPLSFLVMQLVLFFWNHQLILNGEQFT
jgi:3-oxoacyl-[acyl-carrier-protein] synthase III